MVQSDIDLITNAEFDWFMILIVDLFHMYGCVLHGFFSIKLY